MCSREKICTYKYCERIATAPLLSLLPPSCMVVPIRDLGNIASFTSTFHSTTNIMASNDDINLVVDPLDNLFENISDNFDEVRGRSLELSVHHPRTPSMSSSDCDEDYAERMQRESDRVVEDDPVATSNSVQLEYATPKSQNGQQDG